MKQSCSIYDDLSKKTFLAFLGGDSNLNKAEQMSFYKGKFIKTPKTSDVGYTTKTRNYFENLDKKEINWSIVSFDSKTKQVCVEIKTKSGIRHLSVALEN
jgi:hypothetical protein